jgi:hypothetical protein
MRLRRLTKYAIGAGGMLVLVLAILLATGWGTAVAAQISNVFVTNDATHPVPVQEQGTANVNVTNQALGVQATIPSGAFSTDVSLGGVGVVSGPDPAGTKYAITGVVVANTDSTPTFVRVAGRYGSITDCSDLSGTTGTNELPLLAPAQDTISTSFTQPFVISAAPGAAACLIVAPSFATGGRAAVVGYRIH